MTKDNHEFKQRILEDTKSVGVESLRDTLTHVEQTDDDKLVEAIAARLVRREEAKDILKEAMGEFLACQLKRYRPSLRFFASMAILFFIGWLLFSSFPKK